jgi:hypothetical protein
MALDTTSPRSRRALLAGALGAIGSAAAATMAGAQRALGAGSDGETVVIGRTYGDVQSYTTFLSDVGAGLRFKRDQTFNTASVRINPEGVFLQTKGEETVTNMRIGPWIDVDAARYPTGVKARSMDGPAIVGESLGVGVQGGGSTGVRGVGGPDGRGGEFSGPEAQIRLVPSSARTHPTSGRVGDLFLDRSSRLWFCKGHASWVRVA